ncbi:MAG TPA: hypothetical protein VHZ03_14765 [Trebonia sp.]|jgi:hypothetical protein|nr:hypothetical protein [Trebonia sp.]
MQLSTGQQRALFVVLVILLAGVGIYLLGPGRNHGAAASPAASVTPAAATSSPTPTPQAVPSAELAPTPVAAPTTVKSANIYNWLPFTQQDLNESANVALAFAADYETFSYTDSAATYGQRMAKVVTSGSGQLLPSLESGFAPPAVQQQRDQQHLVSKSSGTIVRISSFGASSQATITFVIDITVAKTANGTTTTTSNPWDVTTVEVAGGWQVNNIEPDGAGDQ